MQIGFQMQQHSLTTYRTTQSHNLPNNTVSQLTEQHSLTSYRTTQSHNLPNDTVSQFIERHSLTTYRTTHSHNLPNNKSHNLPNRPTKHLPPPPCDGSGSYSLTCHTCKQPYVGQTIRSPRLRFQEHTRYIRYSNMQLAYPSQPACVWSVLVCVRVC